VHSAGQELLQAVCSEQIKKWKMRKALAVKAAPRLPPLITEALRKCSTHVELITSDNGLSTRVWACRHKFCPICSWRRALKWTGEMSKLPEEASKYRWLFITLTLRTVPVAELEERLGLLSKSWRKLTLQAAWPGVAYLRSIEMTEGMNGLAHPHIHAVVAVPRSFFRGKAYIKQSQWREMWKQAAGVDYLPSVHVRAIKDIASATQEVKKAVNYSLKLSTARPEFLARAAAAMKGKRSVEAGGMLRGWLKSARVRESAPEQTVLGREAWTWETSKYGQALADYSRAVQCPKCLESFVNRYGWPPPGTRAYKIYRGILKRGAGIGIPANATVAEIFKIVGDRLRGESPPPHEGCERRPSAAAS
jgi:plasmid rolling circle replication initiator protein Rep